MYIDKNVDTESTCISKCSYLIMNRYGIVGFNVPIDRMIDRLYCIVLCMLVLQLGTTSTAQSGCTVVRMVVKWRSTFSSAWFTINDCDTWSMISIRCVMHRVLTLN